MPKKNFSLRLVQANGTDKILPHHQSLAISVVRSDAGSISFNYPLTGKNADLLKSYAELRILQEGVELRGCRFLLDDDSEEQASEDGRGAPTSWTGRTWGDAMFDKTIMFPVAMGTNATYVATGDDPGPNFVDFTPGNAIKWLIDQAKARGCFANLAYNFNATTDSAGVAWPSTFTKQYSVGDKYTQILTDLRDLGLIEYEWVGRELKLYVPGYGATMEQDKTLGAHPVTLRKGRDLTSAPVSHSSRDTVTAALVQGDGGIYAQGVAGSSDAPFRVEGFFSESGIVDMGTLQWIGTQRLAMNSSDTSEHTYQLGNIENPTTPEPWVDFYLGDWVYGKTKQNVERLRVAQITVNIADDGVKSGSVVLGDLIEEKAVRLQHRIDKVEQNITTKATAGGNVNKLDATTPKPPTSMVVTTDSYQDAKGNPSAIIFISWAQVTQNTDGTPYTDAGGYRLQWKRSTASVWGPDWTTTPDTFQTSASGLPIGVSVDVRLRAYDLSGHLSTWVTTTLVTSTDTVPPNQPSAPTVDTTTFAGVARITWDGKDYLGNAMPPDFAYLEVHTDTVSPVVPNDGNQKDMLLGAGISVFAGSMGIQRYAAFVAVDKSGNKSAPSASVAFTIRQLVDTDAIDSFVTNRLLGPNVVDTANIKDLAVGTAQMHDLAVVTAKIGSLDLNDAHVGTMSIGKITAGYLGADVTVSARIKTADSGARAEINASGFHVFDGGNVEKITAAIVGGVPTFTVVGGTITSATITSSTVRTAPVGTTRVELSSTSGDRIAFYNGNTLSGTIQVGTDLLDLNVNSSGALVVRMRITNGTTYSFQAFDMQGYSFYMSGGNLNSVGGLNNGNGTITVGASLRLGGANNGNVVEYDAIPAYGTNNGAVIFGNVGTPYTMGKSSSGSVYKKNIKPLADPRRIFKLQAKQFKWNNKMLADNPPPYTHWGFIAEEVWEAGFDNIVHEHEGAVDGVDYSRAWVPLLPIVKEHDDDLEELKAEMAELRQLVKELQPT